MAANENPMAQVVIHPRGNMHTIARIRDAGYRHITHRDGYMRTVHHAMPTPKHRNRPVLRGINPRGGPSPGGGTAA